MAIENLNMTVRGPDAVPGPGPAQKLHIVQRTVEMTAAATDTSTYSFGQVPSNAQLVGYLSKAQWDDLDSAGAPTIDIGLFAVDSNITSDDNALQDGLDVTSAGTAILPAAFAEDGKEMWQYVSGQSTDPGGLFEVKATLQDADADAGGTINLALAYISK